MVDVTQSTLILNYHAESSNDGQLDVAVNSRGFAGHTGLWIHAGVLRSFCVALDQYPVIEPAILIAGEEFDDGPLIRIAVSPVDRVGTLGVRVELAYWADRTRRVCTDLTTNYSEIERFCVAIASALTTGGQISLRGNE